MKGKRRDWSLGGLLASATPIPESGCMLWNDGVTQYGYAYAGDKVLVHRRILELTLGRKLGRLEFACHTCDVRSCINPRHLYVGSSKDNARDRAARNYNMRGERMHGAKLTTEAVLEIRAAPRGWGLDLPLARKFGVSQSAINHARSGRRWRHVVAES